MPGQGKTRSVSSNNQKTVECYREESWPCFSDVVSVTSSRSIIVESLRVVRPNDSYNPVRETIKVRQSTRKPTVEIDGEEEIRKLESHSVISIIRYTGVSRRGCVLAYQILINQK